MSSAATVPAEPEFDRAQMRKAWAILAAMGFGALIAQMFSTVIGPALPTIQQELNISLSQQTWTITAYSLAFGAALVAGGRWGDLVGEVKVIVIGFLVFGVGLVMTAMAEGAGLLIGGRTLQGIGIGVSAPATLSIVVNTFPAAKRGIGVGIWGAAHGLGLLIGPIFAGYLTESVGWRWAFWLSLPMTALVILVTLAATRGYKSHLASGTYDIWGLVFGGISIVLITLGLQNSADGWVRTETAAPLLLGVVFGAIFAVIEAKIEHPLVEFGLWRERLFSGGFWGEFATGFVYIPMLTFIGSLYLIGVLGIAPSSAGWIMVITTGTAMVFNPLGGRWVDRAGPGIPIFTSLILQAVALFWMASFTAETSVGQLIVPLALMGAGAGIALPACNTAGLSAVDKEHAGMGSGLMQTAFNLPAALGVALVTSVIGTVTVGKAQNEAIGQGYGDVVADYAEKVESGHPAPESVLLSLPQDVQDVLQQIVVNAQASAIAFSMVFLGVVALAGAVVSIALIGRRRTPDFIDVDAVPGE